MRRKWTLRWWSIILAFCLWLAPVRVYGQEETQTESGQEETGDNGGREAAQENTQENAEAGDDALIQAPGGVLMEARTGTVIFGKDQDTQRSPASITKIMTLILIFDAIENGTLKMEDTVTTSAHAKSMGGSQVFLEEGETQTVETMIKCIVIASGNDASVAMAEHIGGSEEEFVKRMNERAAELGMKHTHFVDCCGLTDSADHYTTPYDIAVMSRELIPKSWNIPRFGWKTLHMLQGRAPRNLR